MTSKQRAYLKGLASSQDAVFQIGKAGVTPDITTAVSDALEARELLKVNVLKNCPEEVRDISLILSERTRSSVVQVIGRKIILYRQSKTKQTIFLPD